MSQRLLIDSHILIWSLGGSAALSRRAREAILDAETVYVSSASVWEVSIKAAAGKLRIPDDLQKQMSAALFTELPISIEHTVAAAKLPRYHADPFDRMLVAQAVVEGLTLLTSDKRLAEYDVRVMLA